MDKGKYSIYDDGYFGISFLNVDEYAGKLVSWAVGSDVECQDGAQFTGAQISYDLARQSLTVEGVLASNLTNESIALNGLIGCTNAVRGLSGGNYRVAS